MKKIYSNRFLLTLVIAVVGLLCGCSERIVNDRPAENVPLQMKTTFTTGAAVDEIASFTLTVEAEDIDPTIRMELPLVDGQFQAEISVPAGRNRVFTLLALDPDGVVLYRGVTVMDVFPSSSGTPPTITIALLPEVPMIRITPHFRELDMGATFSFDVEVFNLPDLDEISYEFSHYSRVADLDSVTRPASLDAIAYFSYDITQQETGQIAYLYITQVEQEGTLVNNRGYAALGTFYFTSYTDDILELADVDLYLTIQALFADSEGYAVVIPLEEVTVDAAASIRLLRKTWELEYGGYGSDIGYDIIEISDGGFVIAGQYTPGDISEPFLMKIDSLGTYKWGHTFIYDNAGEGAFQALAATSDGGFIMTGYAYVYGDTSSYDVYLAKADAAGNLVWDTVFGESYPSESAYDVIETSDGGYVLCAEKEDSVLLIKTDANGVFAWQTTYKDTVTERHGYHPYSLVQTTDGGYLIAGELAWYSQESGNAFLMKTNATGNFSWLREYDFGNNSEFRDIIRASDGNYVVTGTQDDDVYLAQINVSGDILWDNTYGGSYYDYGYSVDEAANGGFLVTGIYDNYDLGRSYDIYLIRTDAVGDTVWTRTFGTYYYDYGYAGIATSDGGFIATGNVDNYNLNTSDDIVIIKTDADGDTHVRPMLRL
ncbi:MAG: hypothetical protein ACOYVF_08410 [Candidatus Zixiibacteriota bacterium]